MRLLLVVLALIAAPLAAQTYADFGIALVGDEGVRAVLIPPADGSQAILQIDRTGSEFDGLALPVEVITNGDREVYRTAYRGRDWDILLADQAYGRTRYILYPPGRRGEVRMAYDDEASTAIQPGDVVGAVARDAARVEALGRFDRDREEAAALALAQEAGIEVLAACGVQPDVEIDWRSVSDADLTHLSVGSFAATPLEAMARVCREDDALRAAAARVDDVVVTFGQPVALDIRGDRATWSTNGEEPNQSDFAYHALKNVLRTAR